MANIKTYMGIQTYMVETDDIEAIPNYICQDLEINDVIVEIKNGKKYVYRVSLKDSDNMHFVNTEISQLIEVIYTKSDNVWAYNKTTTTEIGSVEPTDVVNIVNDAIEDGDVSVDSKLTISGAFILTNEQIEALKVGDSVVHISGSQTEHYMVSYRTDVALMLYGLTGTGKRYHRFVKNGQDWTHESSGSISYNTGKWVHFPDVVVMGANGSSFSLYSYQWDGDLNEYYGALNDRLQNLASMLSAEIPEVVDNDTANQAFVILVPYLNAIGFTNYKAILNLLVFVYATDHTRQLFGSIYESGIYHDLFSDGDETILFNAGGNWCGFTDLQLITELNNETTTLSSIQLTW